MTERGDVEQFRKLCEKSSFRHRNEILDGISSRVFSLTLRPEARVPVSSMLDIYRVRLRIAEARAPRTEHANSIVGDVKEYVAGLETVSGDNIRAWHLSFDDISHFSAFEAVNAGRLVGCIYGIDRRKVTQEQWNELWGEL